MLHRSARLDTGFSPGRAAWHCAAQGKPGANPAPDVLVLSNGDVLHGKFVSEGAGKVTFHSDPLGDITVGWDKIKELHTSGKFAVFDDRTKPLGKKAAKQLAVGTLEVINQTLTVHKENAAAETPIPVKDAGICYGRVIARQADESLAWLLPGLERRSDRRRDAGDGDQNQYTVSGGMGLVRAVPTVSWLSPRDRTSVDFSGSFGKITEPGYTSGSTTVAPVVTKSAILHVDAERDEYVSPRFFALGQTAFDHNYSQDLNLQQIYGGGFGWTMLKTAKQEADLKGTVQYEKQQFIAGGASAGT